MCSCHYHIPVVKLSVFEVAPLGPTFQPGSVGLSIYCTVLLVALCLLQKTPEKWAIARIPQTTPPDAVIIAGNKSEQSEESHQMLRLQPLWKNFSLATLANVNVRCKRDELTEMSWRSKLALLPFAAWVRLFITNSCSLASCRTTGGTIQTQLQRWWSPRPHARASGCVLP